MDYKNQKLINKIEEYLISGKLKKFKSLMEENKEYLNIEGGTETWLTLATRKGHLEIVEFLVELGIDINQKDAIYHTNALSIAISEEHDDIAEYLVSKQISFDISNMYTNPLFKAIKKGNLKIVKLLIEKGIDLHVKYTDDVFNNMDAFAYAIEKKQYEIADVIRPVIEDADERENINHRFEVEEEDNNRTRLEKFISSEFGEIENVINEILPDDPSISVCIVKPNEKRDYYSLVTIGMSEYPMGDSDDKYAELVMKLPKDWLMDEKDMKDINNFWPIENIKLMATVPHSYDIVFTNGDIFSGDDGDYFAENTKFSCLLLVEDKALIYKEEIDGEVIDIKFFTVVPIYEEEYKVAEKKGGTYLIKEFGKYKITDVVDIGRQNIELDKK